MHNPFIEIRDDSERDEDIIARILGGDAGALERLVYRHQAWIYNIALRMVLDPHEAEDVTQEILIKVITHLSGFDPAKGALRTWIYRAAANHVLNMKSRGPEILLGQIRIRDGFSLEPEEIEDTRVTNRPEHALLAGETKDLCLAGLLLCLERRQRLAFILGEMFGVPSRLGAELVEVSGANFRALLSRAKKRLSNFLNSRCSLIDPSNPCRCSRQVENMVRMNWLIPGDASAAHGKPRKISEVVHAKARACERDLADALRLYRDSPFREGPEFWIRIRDIIARGDIQDASPLQ